MRTGYCAIYELTFTFMPVCSFATYFLTGRQKYCYILVSAEILPKCKIIIVNMDISVCQNWLPITIMLSVCKHFRNGYVDRYKRSLTTYSIKMTNLLIHGMYFLL